MEYSRKEVFLSAQGVQTIISKDKLKNKGKRWVS